MPCGPSRNRTEENRLLLQEALEFQPVRKAINPVVCWNVLLPHAEAVAALRVHVQLGGLVRVGPTLIEQHADRREAEVIVRGCRDEHRWRVLWDGQVFEVFAARINRGNKGGAAVSLVSERHADGDSAAG